ncbi:MAG TPA: lipid-binding SYLF domain-containing protein, partial [Vicinamibacterales bacterium]|nr:lipid-binding SYLF domain-containing protein [Vicinamibacterales bacterium]
MNPRRVFAIGLALAGLAVPGPIAAAGATQDRPPQTKADDKDLKQAEENVQQSLDVLTELTKVPEDRIPAHLLERAEAIVVIPTLVRGGFIVGAKHGTGLVSVRNRATNSWSAPAFVKMTGGSIGWQIGAQSVDVVLLVMNKRGVDDLLSDKFTLGGSLSVAAGPVGRSADASTDAKMSAQILAYSRAKGLFAGATLEGASIHTDDGNNEAVYGAGKDVKQ